MSAVVLGCMHACGGASGDGTDAAVLSVPCAGRLELSTLLWPFAVGRSGVLVLSCPPSECRHRRCEEEPCAASGAERVAEAREVIARAGLSPKRVAHRVIGRHDDVEQIVGAYRADVEQLDGWERTTLRAPSEEIERFSSDRCARLFARVQANRDWRSGEPAPRPESLGQRGDLLWTGCLELRDLAIADRDRISPALELWSRAGNATSAVASWRCCGQPLLEAEETEAFAALAEANARMIEASGARRVVTACPHCLATFTEAYRDAGVRVRASFVSLWEWAEEALEVVSDGEPMALVVSPMTPEMQRVEVSALTSLVPRLRRLEWPPESAGDAELEGTALTSLVVDLYGRADDDGATAIIMTSPHDAGRWRAVFGPSRWQVTPFIPVIDLPQAMLGLLRQRS